MARKRQFSSGDIAHRAEAGRYLITADEFLRAAVDSFAQNKRKQVGLMIDTTYSFLGRAKANIESIDGSREDLNNTYHQISQATIELDQALGEGGGNNG